MDFVQLNHLQFKFVHNDWTISNESAARMTIEKIRRINYTLQKVWGFPDLRECSTSWSWWGACRASPSAGRRSEQSPSRRRCVGEPRSASTWERPPRDLRSGPWTSPQTDGRGGPSHLSYILKLPVKPVHETKLKLNYEYNVMQFN